MDNTISVIIPTFNRQNTILRAVSSALQQTYPITEILICDDGSDDNSREIISALNNPKVKWLDCGKNGRPSIPRNKGIEAAKGEWIAFLDSDDEWLPNKIAIQIKHLEETSSQAVSCNAYRIKGKKSMGPYLNNRSNFLTFKEFLSANFNICSSVVLKRKLLYEVSFFPEEIEYKAIEDYVLWLRISTKTNFAYIKQPLLKYYDNPASSLRVFYKDVLVLRRVVFSGFLEWIKQHEIILQPDDEIKLGIVCNEIFEKKTFPKRVKHLFRRLKNLSFCFIM